MAKEKRQVSELKLLLATFAAHGVSDAMASLALAPVHRLKLLLQLYSHRPSTGSVASNLQDNFSKPNGYYRTIMQGSSTTRGRAESAPAGSFSLSTKKNDCESSKSEGSRGQQASTSRLPCVPSVMKTPEAYLTTTATKAEDSRKTASHVTFDGMKLREVTKVVYTQNGIRAFWWGALPHMTNTLLSALVRTSCYHKCAQFLQDASEVVFVNRHHKTCHNNRGTPPSRYGTERPAAANDESGNKPVHHHGGGGGGGRAKKYLSEVLNYSVGGAMALIVVYPLDVFHVWRAGDVSTKRLSIWATLSQTVRHNGFLCMYRGLGLSLASVLPFTSICLLVNNFLQNQVLVRQHQQRLNKASYLCDGKEALCEDNNSPAGSSSPPVAASFSYPPSELQMEEAVTAEPMRLFPYNFMAGVLAGLTAQTIFYPIDTIRRRYIFDGVSRWTAPPFRREYASLYNCMQISVRGGFRSLYAGCFLNVLKTVPQSFVLSALYVLIKSTLPP
eukprot:GHVS01021681.1.p1 GENE.GHVS01021681.1~~GHVS01021681.1.p1  ORF type:complete len:501 (+),score=80.74 GHVS01021681.1:166-1668(+)